MVVDEWDTAGHSGAVTAYNFTAVVDPEGESPDATRNVDGFKFTNVPQETVEMASRIEVDPDNIPVVVNLPCLGQRGTRKINRCELAIAQQKATVALTANRTRCNCAVTPAADDVTMVIDTHEACAGGILDVKYREPVPVHQVAVRLAVASLEDSHDVATGVDPVCIGLDPAGDINRCESAPL